jgi:DNA polymerase I-like protein with 3'-5' exonuclease and polymerase domains
MFTTSKIVSIESVGIKTVCDITIENDHSYIANGIVNHNSSNNPNFQNLPRTTTNPDIKRMMIPSEGKVFLMMDYSQAELRVLAHLAKETTMLEWFRTGKDIHLATACKKYKEDYEEIFKIYSDETHPEYKKWKMRRKQAKTINFGIAYEQTAMKLSESLSEPNMGIIVSIEEAQIELDNWFKDFPKVKKFIEKQHKLAEKQGWVKTMFGRKRRLPGVYSENYREYLEALRFSSNAPIQGTATDFALFSSILMWEKVKLGELPYFHECTTVHDSLVFEIDPKDITPKLIYDMWNICRNPSTKKYFGFQITDVDMAVDFGIGRTYAEELPFVPDYDYRKLLLPDFNKDDYYQAHKQTKHIDISDYPKKFKSSFKSA